MNISINAVFRKDRLNSQNAAPVHLRLTQNRKLKHISTGVTLNINEWDFENQRVMGQTPELQALQLRIDTKIDELRRKIKRLEALEVEVTLDNLLETNGRKINCTVGEYLKQTIERLETLGKYGSASKHRSLLSRLSQFRSLNIRFDEIDLAYLHDFELFLRKEGNTNNSIATKYAIFKAAYNKALAEGLFVPKTTPFTKYKVGSLWTRTRKRAITKEDIQKLVALEIAPNYRTDYAEFARDIFLFSYYTAGINFTDMATLRYCDIVDGRIYYSRHKTQKLLSFQLVPNALQIIEKYTHLPGKSCSSSKSSAMATIFAWSGAFKKRGELDNLPELVHFGEALEAASLQTLNEGIMTKDLCGLAEGITPTAVDSEGFIKAIRERLEAKLA